MKKNFRCFSTSKDLFCNLKSVLMIKNVFILSLICFSTLFSFGQSKIIFFDSISKLPVWNAAVFNSSNELVALSNEIGEVKIQNQVFPLFVKVFNYEMLKMLEFKDTFYLVPKMKQIEEVKIKPIDIPLMYQNMIKESNKKAVLDKNTLVSGTYFQSVLIIDLTSGDSAFLTKICDLDIRKMHDSKKIKYKLFPSSGRKLYWTTSNQKSFDTSMLQLWLNTIPKFNSLLNMDLSDIGKYEINFKNKEIKNRSEKSFSVFENKGESSVNYKIGYQQNFLESYEFAILNECNKNSNMATCVPKYVISAQFRNDSTSHYLSNCYRSRDYNFQVNAKKYIIKMHQGFIENQSKPTNETIEYKDIEDYFETFPFDTNADYMNLYLFDK